MMLVGDPQEWTKRFRTIDVRFLERVIAVWPQCLGVLPCNPLEDEITINLVSTLLKDSKARCLFHHLEYQYEPFGYTAEGLAYSKGKIDMALLVDQERERYLAYECKRLNVVSKGTTRSLATPYVLDGMSRFIIEQYAADLPVGCMLGYVMDGRLNTAQAKVRRAIASNKREIGLVYGPIDEKPLGPIERLTSFHWRVPSGTTIEIRHALLPLT